MNTQAILTTNRLKLIPFVSEHLEGLFKMNSDPEVMRYLGPPETREQTEASILRQQEKWAKYGFGWWSVFEHDSDELIGAACLQHLGHVETNPLEIGWRLLPKARGQGYATEAGQAAMDYGFETIGQTYLTAVTDTENKASARVMERLGMTYVGIQTHYDVPCVTYEMHKPD